MAEELDYEELNWRDDPELREEEQERSKQAFKRAIRKGEKLFLLDCDTHHGAIVARSSMYRYIDAVIRKSNGNTCRISQSVYISDTLRDLEIIQSVIVTHGAKAHIHAAYSLSEYEIE